MFFIFIFLSLFIYLERGRESTSRQGQKDGWRERIPGRLFAVITEPDAGFSLTNWKIMTWAQIKSQMLNRLSHPDAPLLKSFKVLFYIFRFSPPECMFWKDIRYLILFSMQLIKWPLAIYWIICSFPLICNIRPVILYTFLYAWVYFCTVNSVLLIYFFLLKFF